MCADDVDTFRTLLAQGHDPCGYDAGGTTLWSIANEYSSSCCRILCAHRPADTLLYRHAAYLPVSNKFLCRANVNHRVGLLLLLHPRR